MAHISVRAWPDQSSAPKGAPSNGRPPNGRACIVCVVVADSETASRNRLGLFGPLGPVPSPFLLRDSPHRLVTQPWGSPCLLHDSPHRLESPLLSVSQAVRNLIPFGIVRGPNAQLLSAAPEGVPLTQCELHAEKGAGVSSPLITQVHWCVHPFRVLLVLTYIEEYSGVWNQNLRKLAHPAVRQTRSVQAHHRVLAAHSAWRCTEPRVRVLGLLRQEPG
ncbi:hypothetical protein CB1_001338002 [Camelus ferus]|nr:hypothetical protein CB1_001338002 [Camelus ferus]